jgi:hypothetical protein
MFELDFAVPGTEVIPVPFHHAALCSAHLSAGPRFFALA